jgi:hypothetical protein
MGRRLRVLEADDRRHPCVTHRVTTFVVLLCFLPACGVSGLNFKQDERLEVTAPGDRAEVQLPITVSWRVRDFEVVGRDGSDRSDAGYFGVFVDRAPQPPDRTQAWLVRDDPRCRTTPSSCAKGSFLAPNNIHSTTDTRFVIDRLPAPSTNAPRRREFHEVTIVLLNGRGERIGESAFVRQFEVDRSV